jgi:TRAP-type C4-dicarboxylate transport system permease small subunit
MGAVAELLPGRWKIALEALELILVITLAAFALVQSVRYVADMMRFGVKSPLAQIPMWIPHSAVAVGFTLIALVALLAIVREARA